MYWAKRLLVAITFILSNLALANPVYDVHFSKEEIQKHKENIDTIVNTAASCLDDTYAEHLAFFREHGVSKFYGDRREQHHTKQGRLNELIRFGAKNPERLVDELEPISCIGLTMRCLQEGFETAGTASTWQKIYNHLIIDNKVYGTDLQILLQKLGWQIYYWNPNPANNAKWDAEDRKINPLKNGKKWNSVWGAHAYNYSRVMNKNIYYQSKVDNKSTLVDFGTQPPEEFKHIPFFVGIAHQGYHVFPGRYGDIIEAHSTRLLNSIDNLEFSEFNPLGQGGGPRWTRTEKYRSGLIAVPPQSSK